MARKICTAGAIGSISFIVLDQQGDAVSAIRTEQDEELVTHHIDIDEATKWTEHKVLELIGKRYEAD